MRKTLVMVLCGVALSAPASLAHDSDEPHHAVRTLVCMNCADTWSCDEIGDLVGPRCWEAAQMELETLRARVRELEERLGIKPAQTSKTRDARHTVRRPRGSL